ncbi:MAG: DUF983 domain-containing protein [Rhizobiales bacterium]|nr:DUF983 domain-containing protein [Hyphomicrobiales bacterium]
MSSDHASPRDAITAARPLSRSLLRGAGGKCPSCGAGKVFDQYLKVIDECAVCGEELHHHRADDAPPYFTIFIVGHILIPLALVVERVWRPDMFVHMALWLPLALAMTLLLLPVIKGAVVGLQWSLRMHGFEYAASRHCRPQKPK